MSSFDLGLVGLHLLVVVVDVGVGTSIGHVAMFHQERNLFLATQRRIGSQQTFSNRNKKGASAPFLNPFFITRYFFKTLLRIHVTI